MGGGFTANNQTYAFKTYTPPHKRAKQEERERDREKNEANQAILGSIGISKIELHAEYFSKITACYMFSRNPMGSLRMQGFQF